MDNHEIPELKPDEFSIVNTENCSGRSRVAPLYKNGVHKINPLLMVLRSHGIYVPTPKRFAGYDVNLIPSKSSRVILPI